MRLYPDADKTRNFEVHAHRTRHKVHDGELMHAKSSCRCFPDDEWETFSVMVKDWLREHSKTKEPDDSTKAGPMKGRNTIPELQYYTKEIM